MKIPFEEEIPGGDVHDLALSDAISERYLSYALSIIMSRSLPDVRDGLKPVHRRLLYAMRLLKLNPDQGYKKCARVIGDVIGKYHPHGDQSVYNALVRLAQNFAVRYPLVDGQGNFGNIDGDNPAAMRYTEARLTDVASSILEGIDEDAVDFKETYDGEDKEPIVMPSTIPNLLANGGEGIAVGMACSIPPHNLEELCQALLHLIKFPNASLKKMIEFIPGPDFPTGGILVETKEMILAAYTTGRGGFRVRSRWSVEKQSRGQYLIVINEIPYQIQKSRLIEKIAELLLAKKLPFLEDIRDESAEDIRIVLEPRKRSLDPKILMEQMFRLTDLETRISLNMNVLDSENTPKVMNIKEVLSAFLSHRHVVLMRRTQFRLNKIDHRIEVLEGYLAAYLNLDEVIRIIREEDNPKKQFIIAFSLTEVQAEAILNMRLRSLRKLEEIELRAEHKELSTERVGLKKLQSDDIIQWTTISEEIKKTKKRFSAKTNSEYGRRTLIEEGLEKIEIPDDIFTEKEPITIIFSNKDWIKTSKSHIDLSGDIKFKDGDSSKFIFHAESTDKVVFFASNGRFFTIQADKLPSGRGFGSPLRLMIDLPNEEEIISVFSFKENVKYIIASESGRGFIVKSEDLIAQTKNGKQILNLKQEDQAVAITEYLGSSVAVIGLNRKLLVFESSEIPEMSKGRGVILQKFKDGGISDITSFDPKDGLSWKSGDKIRTEKELTPWIGKRSQSGRLAPKGFAKSNKFK
ncbi:MAG: DNA topoisomerase IV subunit A [Rhodospirillaceae bacterium]|nr:DNA topoisomerase IV subunit A [Rhodospirillaceae bacterium]